MDLSHALSPVQVISCPDNEKFQSECGKMIRAGYVLVSAGAIRKQPDEENYQLLTWWGVFVERGFALK